MKWLGILTRTLSCFLLVFATWNPEGYSYFDWVVRDQDSLLSAKVAIGTFLFGCYVLYLRATWVSLGILGIAALASVVLTGYLSMRRLGLLDAAAPFWSGYIVLVLLAITLSVGICWSHMKRRITGQSQVLSPPP